MVWFPRRKEAEKVSEMRISLDPLNPGQFFACCGLFETIVHEEDNALARFELDASRPRAAVFCVETRVELQGVLARLRAASAEFPDKKVEAAIRPATISYNGSRIELDWWLDPFREKAGNLKCWAGQVTTENLFSELLPMLDEASQGAHLFERWLMTKAKFGVDPRSAWNALDFGFSPNEHGADAATFPAVEVLAAIGLQSFRPKLDRRNGISYSSYALWQEPLPAAVARMAFRAPWLGLGCREYEFSIAKRGQSYKYFTFAKEK
jgi:CRISPR-associated protein Csx14